MGKSYLAFDLGASSGRAIIGRLDGQRLKLDEVHRFSNGPIERDGSLYWDFPALRDEIVAGLKKGLEAAPDIAGIAIDTWGVDYVLFNKSTGKMARLPYHYRDARTDAAPERVFQLISQEELYAETGIQFMQLNTLYQLVAHQERHPEDFADAVMLLMPDALSFILSGVMAAEYSEASTTNLLNPKTRDWHFPLIDRLGLPRSIFPEIVHPCSVSGTLKPELQKQLNCGAIPVFRVGSHDTASAVAAVPAVSRRDWAYVSCGTWALLGAELDAPLCSAAAGQAAFTNEGGVAGKIRFLTNIMGTWLMQETRRVWQERGDDLSFRQLEAMAAGAPAMKFFINPNDKLFLSPGDMPGRVAEFCEKTGQGAIPDKKAVIRCLYDSLALCFRTKIDELQKLLNVNYQCLNVVGGGTRDKLLMQLTADCLGIPVVAGPVEATAIGNILGQGIADGAIQSLGAARKIVGESFDVVEYVPTTADKASWDQATRRFAAICS